ncbi:non-ribosomal peptide synthetase [Streptomyces sp. MJM8645]|uniref:non-ribosomal peptide synthetase n=2 Tax=Streptomycetaceae TaxID=2062 RepID=UPI0007AFDAA9|nr:non-ribosomal peptide synthetase [Streptomyces sp. MJM8645]
MSRDTSLPLRGDRARAPLSYAQRSIWRAEQVLPGTALHNESAAFHVSGPLDVAALERALAAVARRHEVVRCAVAADGAGEPWQLFADRVRPAVETVDLTGVPEGERAERLAELTARAVAVPFDLARPPLMRTQLFLLGGGRSLLLFTAHHIVVDAWGFGVFLESLAACYAAELGGEAPAPFPAGGPDFGDFAAWQRAEAGEGGDTSHAGGIDHWQTRLGGELPTADLPSDVGPGGDPAAGALHHFTVPAELAARLSAFGRGELASLSTVLLTAFCATAARWTGQDDLVVGMPVATRGRTALAGVVGPLLNLVAHRSDLGGEPSFRQALARTRQHLKADLRHRDTPFDLVLERLGRAAGGRTPLFQLMYSFHSGPTTTLELPGVTTAPAPSHSGTAKYDLTFFLRPRPSGALDATLEYRTALLAPETAADFADSLLCLLEAAAADPDRPLAELPVLSEGRRRRVLVDFNRAPDAERAWATAPEALRELARQSGAAPAVESPGHAFSRAAADAAADRVARRLVARHGVAPGDRVALRVERGAQLVPLIVGIWRAGAVLVPLDEAMPAARAEHVLADSGARLLIGDPATGLPAADPAALLDEGPDASDSGAGEPLPGAGPEDLAYLMYTSGSTGLPKGVAVPHGCVANLLHSVVRAEPGLRADDTLLAVTSITFDISVLELFAPLLAGGRVVVAPRESVRDAEALGALLERSGATVMQATPSLWRGLLDGGWAGRPGLRALCGGEALDADLADRLLARCAGLWNLYGPTETTIWSTVGRVLPGEGVTVGRPVAGTVCYVLDRRLRPVPRGAVGELVIGGAGVSAGYRNRPELTAAAFVADPVDPAGGTVYRTGDLARHLPDGRIVVLGRADQQVKILGHRIEVGEVESLLAAHPEVRQAAVVVDRGQPAGPRLVAFVTARTEDDGLPDRLRRHLRERLPAAAVPGVIAPLPALPLNTSGKVDRPALLLRAGELTAARRAAPVTEAEQAAVALWAEVLGLPPERVGTTDDFFAAGGNSIAATRLLGRVRARFGAAPSLADFYTDPTPAALARVRPAAPAPAVRTAGPAPDAVPMTDQQRQLWLLHRLAPDSPAYHLPAALDLTGPVDEAALTGALADLTARHPVLAARCELREDGPVLVLAPPAAPALTVLDAAPEEVPELARAEAVRPFDLAGEPPLRLTLVRTGPERSVLLCTAHHLAVDGWSIGVAVRELAALYAARLGLAEPPPALDLDFAGYAADCADEAGLTLRQDHLEYWLKRLDGHPGVLDLPADAPTRTRPTGAGETLPVALAPELTAALREGAAQLRTTPFTLLLAVYAALLGRYAGSDDVLVGVPVANRDRPELESLVGSLANTLPVRVDLAGAPSFAELAARTGRALAGDLGRPLVAFDRLVAGLGLPRELGRPTLVQASLVFQDAPPADVRLGAAAGVLRQVPTGAAKYDLTLALDERADRIAGALEYATDRFGPQFADRFARHFHVLLRAALASPQAPLDAVELTDPALPAPRPARPAGEARAEHAASVSELFRARAAARPDAPAIRAEGVTVGYRQLDAWSDRIAARLLERGAAPGRFVSVLLPPGPVQSAAILGVAKTGAAFAVLDPADPDARLTALLADAEPVCLLAAESTLALHPELREGDGHFAGIPVEVVDPRVPAADEPAGPAPAASPAGPGDPLCLVYTSGSTGTPKGIALPHAALAQFAHWQREHFGIRPDSRIAQWAPFTYDAAYTEVFAALCSGAVLCLPPQGLRRDPLAVAGWLRAERITQIQTVPAFFQLVTEALDATGSHLPDLAHVLMAGEVLPVALAAAWAHRPDRPRLHNLYGPTECVLATHRELAPGEEFPAGVPIGSPIPGREAVVLDRRGRLCPVGVVGEIHLRSDFLAGSYHRRPEESARAYVADPWQAGGRLYRTGDLGRRLPDGELAFVGRIGSQLKIRGNRIELEEIEALLELHPGVREAAAAAHGQGGARRLVGYAVAAPGVTGAELRAHLAERLPAAVVPDTVLLLDALPRTRTNKRDRARLPLPGAAARPADAAPLAGVEQLVADAWRRLLGGGPVGRHTNFFEAGGDSLLAARLQLELARRLERPVRLVDIFGRPTIAEFAAGLTEGAAPDGRAAAETAEPRGERRQSAVRARAKARREARDRAEGPAADQHTPAGPTTRTAPTGRD